MNVDTQAPEVLAAGRDPALLRRLGALTLFAAIYTYALIVFGGFVRITGSGMGCGDDWPRCNGRWIPVFTVETLIEYTHRLLAAGIGVVVLAVFAYALLHRRAPGIAGRGGVLRALLVAGVLLGVQVALGAITVRLELPTEVTVLHFMTALLFMAALLVSAVRAGTFGSPAAPAADLRNARRSANAALIAAVLGLIVVSFGAVTANTPGAPLACQGFPLCNGELVPRAQIAEVHIHWTHRLLAFLLLAHAAGATLMTRLRGASPAVVKSATAVLLLVVTQIAVAAALVLLFLPRFLQGLHLAVGAAIWFALVVWVTLARRELHTAHSPSILDHAMTPR
jgi:heme A synthase